MYLPDNYHVDQGSICGYRKISSALAQAGAFGQILSSYIFKVDIEFSTYNWKPLTISSTREISR